MGPLRTPAKQAMRHLLSPGRRAVGGARRGKTATRAPWLSEIRGQRQNAMRVAFEGRQGRPRRARRAVSEGRLAPLCRARGPQVPLRRSTKLELTSVSWSLVDRESADELAAGLVVLGDDAGPEGEGEARRQLDLENGAAGGVDRRRARIGVVLAAPADAELAVDGGVEGPEAVRRIDRHLDRMRVR